MNFNKLIEEDDNIANQEREKSKKSPFAKKSVLWDLDFKKGIKWNIPKINISNLDKRMLVVNWLWIILIGLLYISYNNELIGKVQELPTLRNEVSILDKNIKKQKDEIKALEEINVSNIDSKYETLNQSLRTYSPELHVNQINALYEIAKASGLEIETLQKIPIKMDEKILDDLDQELADFWIDNFLEDAWYTKYSISAVTSEKVMLRFKEKLEERAEFMFDAFSISESNGDLKYNFTIKAFYSLNDQIDG